MKTIAQILLISALFLGNRSFAVVNQRLEIQGTNLVLSWPSTGNELYLIQYRPSLDTND